MLSRRDLLMSGALASSLRPGEPAAAQMQRSSQAGGDPVDQDLHEIRDALRDLLQRLTPSRDVTEIRDKQRLHFKLTQKFPDFIDIGIQVWERLYTWHLENKLPLKAVRTPEGRMEMEFMFTTLLLRSDIPDTQIGVAYDR
jgi:hypothetical protein